MVGHPRRRPARGTPRRGQSLVELALMTPLVLLLLVGTVDLGRAFFYYTRLTNSVREGALFGARTPALVSHPGDTTVPAGLRNADPNNLKYYVKQESLGSLGLTDAAITVTCYATKEYGLATTTTKACDTAVAGDSLAVRATYEFRPLTGELARLFGGPLRLGKTVRVVIL